MASQSLKQSIVIKNTFTVKSGGSGGTRGGTPGQYVMRYMARDDATEIVAPVPMPASRVSEMAHLPETQDAVARMTAPTQPFDSSDLSHTNVNQTELGQTFNSDIFMRYMARADATEALKKDKASFFDKEEVEGHSPLVLKHSFKKRERLSGRAFGSRSINLEHDELQASSDAIQDAFNQGHAVQLVVLSFTEEYLRDTGIVAQDFKKKGRGSYRGNIDQLKLRHAITDGMTALTKAGDYSAPEWVGTIQVDTGHVHAHIALTDTAFSESRLVKKPIRSSSANVLQDRGKINEREKRALRKGLHTSLSHMKPLHSFHAQVSADRQNVTAFVKNYAYHELGQNADMQSLVASLPRNKKEWRYGTNRTSMKRPNELATRIINQTFEQEPERSGYATAIRSIHTYADEAQKVYRLTSDERDTYVERGRELLVERSVNQLYRSLRDLEPEQLHTRTPMLDMQTLDDTELKLAMQASANIGANPVQAFQPSSTDNAPESFDPIAFQLRVRGYQTRQDHHAKKSSELFAYSQEYDEAERLDLVDPSANVMRLYYEEELRYHMGVTDKYRSFLSYNHERERQNVSAMMPTYQSLQQEFHSIRARESMADTILEDERDVYTQKLRAYTFENFRRGVGTLKEWDAIHDVTEHHEREVYHNPETGEPDIRSRRDARQDRVTTRFVLPFSPKTTFENMTTEHFNHVKAFDVHHLGVDYYSQPDKRIDDTNALRFASRFESRKERTTYARAYMDESGQDLPALRETERDLVDMEEAVNQALRNGLIHTVDFDELERTETLTPRFRRTIALDQTLDTMTPTQQAVQGFEQDLRTGELDLEVGTSSSADDLEV